MVKNPSSNAGDVRDAGSIPGSGRFLGGGHGDPFQYSCLENPMGRGPWWATVHRVAKNWAQMSDLTCIHIFTWDMINFSSEWSHLFLCITLPYF